LLSEKLNFENVLGVDQSKPIIRKARSLTEDSKYQGRVVFRNQNVLELDRVKISPANLVLFPNAAHHFSTLEDVRSVLTVSETYLAPDGVILLTDLARLKTNQITSDFVKLAGQEFIDLNMPSMYQDFHDSMYAAWLPEELATSIPIHSRLSWFQLALPGLSCFQALFGIPKDRTKIFLNDSKDWTESNILRSPGARAGWDFLGKVLYEASPKEINSPSRAS
jgi:hypothetical protein